MYAPHDSEIREEISAVFDKEKLDLERGKTWTIIDGIVKYKNWDLLVAYFQGLWEEDKNIFCEIIIEKIDGMLSSLCFYILICLWYIKEALDASYSIGNNNYTLLVFLYELFANKIYRFNSQQLWILKSFIDTMRRGGGNFEILGYRLDDIQKSLYELIIELRYEHFEKSIQWINLEINSDKQQVQEYLKNFGFDTKYNITLNKLDQYIQSEQGEWEVVPWWVIGILREFFKSFYMDLAKKIATSNWLTEVPHHTSSTTDIGHARHYIKEQFNLSSDEYKLLDSYKDITNNEGSHALLSEKKYLRLARNIGIEISLFMLEKLKDYIKNIDSH